MSKNTIMSGLTVSFAVVLMLSFWVSPGYAELENCGLHGEYFHDTTTGLYWFDPVIFQGAYRGSIETTVTHSTTWNWATSAQVDALVGQTAATGFSLEDIIGIRFSTIGSGGPRWLAYYAEADPDGWLIQSSSSPDFNTFTDSGSQGGAAALGAGGWLVSSIDPSVATAVLENLGDSGEYFHDLDTDFYWCDPATFFDMPRDDVETWLGLNTGWRWATAEEIYVLLGKTSTDGTPLDEILGERSSTVASGGPRWVGYYDQAMEPNGILVQAGVAPHFDLLEVGGTQGNAGSSGAGAWIISESDPTPTETRSLGGVKTLYR